MNASNYSLEDEFYASYGRRRSYEETFTFLDIFGLDLVDRERVVFMVISACIAIIGVLASLCIIVANVLYRLRYSMENDFYNSSRRSSSRTSFGVNTIRTNFIPENRFSYFSALSGQARFRYSHVIFSVAIFNLVACLTFIPLAVITVCGGTEDADTDNAIVFFCVAWSVFQILFIAIFFFINTAIQFSSVIFPLTFRLSKSPLWLSFLAIVIVCLILAILTVDVIYKQLHQALFEVSIGTKFESLERSISHIQIVLSLPLTVFYVTLITTIAMYIAIIRQIHIANKAVARLSQSQDEASQASSLSHSSIWRTTIKKNIKKSIILGAGVTVFYLLEAPSFFVVYGIVSPQSWILLCHLAVNACAPLIHIMVSKSFRIALWSVLGNKRPSWDKHQVSMSGDRARTSMSTIVIDI